MVAEKTFCQSLCWWTTCACVPRIHYFGIEGSVTGTFALSDSECPPTTSQGTTVAVLLIAETNYISTQTTLSGTMKITKEYVQGCSGPTERFHYS